jgi:hypothetical protein
MKSTNRLVSNLMNEGINTTSNIGEAIYLLADGQMIDGQCDMGMRSEDHRCIFAGTDYGDYYESSNTAKTHWDRIHKEYRVVRLCPESNVALVKGRQRLTDTQKQILAATDYELERY